MGDLIQLNGVALEKEREQRVRMAESLRELAQRAEEGELHAVVFVAIPEDRANLTIGLLRTSVTSLAELVGATTILNDYLRKEVLE